MALTIEQAAVLSTNKIVKGITMEILKVSPMLTKLPFLPLSGNALQITRESATGQPTVAFRQVGGVWTESSGTVDTTTAVLKILGGDADVDNFLKQTLSNENDQMAVQLKMKSKAMAKEWEETMIYGVASGSNEFDGLHALMPSTQEIPLGTSATGAPLTTNAMDRLVDAILGGKPDMILMNKQIRRRFSEYLRGVGSYQTQRDAYGNYFVMWNEVPIMVSDYLLQTETIATNVYSAPTGGATSTVFAVRFGEGDGLVGIQNGGITTEVFPKLETKDASRVRIKWYCGTALFQTTAIACITGVTDAAVSA